MESLTLNLFSTIQLIKTQFAEICHNNRDLRFELGAVNQLR